MNIPKSYEALAADLASEKILSKTLLGQKEAYMMLADARNVEIDGALASEAALLEGLTTARRDFDYDRGFSAGSAEVETLRIERDALQQRLTVAEQRESEAREELLDLSRKLDVFYSRSHGIKNLSAIEDANDKSKALQQRLTFAEQRADDMVYALARIQGRAEMFIDDGMHMPTPYIEAIRDIAAKAALKQVEDAKSSPSCPNCKVCMGSPDFPENCLIKGASHEQ